MRSRLKQKGQSRPHLTKGILGRKEKEKSFFQGSAPEHLEESIPS